MNPVPRSRQTQPPPPGAEPVSVVIGTGELATAARDELTPVTAHVHAAASLEELRDWSPGEGRWVALVVLLDRDDDVAIDPVVQALSGLPTFADARLLVVTTRRSLSDMSRSVDAGHVDGVVAAPWTPGNLVRYAEAQVSRATHLVGRSAPWEQNDSELLRHLAMGPEAAAAELLQALEEVLGPRPRVHLDKGVRIAVPQERMNQVFLVLKGKVVLTVTSPAGEVVLHHASTGPLVGLVALTEMQHSTVTARTTTPCEMVSLTLEQLDFALERDPRVGTTLMALTMRALARRLRRSEQLHIKNATLSAELRATLEELRAARAELVEQARMATLGELAAGVAHELNNPAATVTRGVDHLSADLRALLGAAGSGDPGDDEEPEPPAQRGVRGVRAVLPGRSRARSGSRESRASSPEARGSAPQVEAAVLDALVSAEERDHVSAREERTLRRALAQVVPDPSMVRRLVAAGVTDPERARELVEGPSGTLARVESAAGIGATLRAVRVAADHIATLVSALRAHARPEPAEEQGELQEPTDVGGTVRDALRLLEHRLGGIAVEVDVEPDLPPVDSGPGLLAQVWTNLLANAADALTGEGGSETDGDGAVGEPHAEGESHAEGGAHPGRGRIQVRVRAGRPHEEAGRIPPQPSAMETGALYLPRPDEESRATAVVVEIEDDGPGVPAPLQEQIFAARFTTKHGVVRYGLGLGLGIARGIVARHGGRIGLESEPGRTVFAVELPAAGEAPLTPTLADLDEGQDQGMEER